MQYKCVCNIITRRDGAALGMQGQLASRLNVSVDGEGNPVELRWPLSFGPYPLLFAGFGLGPLLDVERVQLVGVRQ